MLGEDAPVGSLKLLFDPANAKKLSSCGNRGAGQRAGTVPGGAALCGAQPAGPSRRPTSPRRSKVLTAIRPYIRKFHSSEYINDIGQRRYLHRLRVFGRRRRRRTVPPTPRTRVEIAYTIPAEGAMIWIDMMAIPKDAPHPGNALLWIDNNSQSAGRGVDQQHGRLRQSQSEGDAVRPRRDPQRSRHLSAAGGAQAPVLRQAGDAGIQRARTRAWTRVKTGS